MATALNNSLVTCALFQLLAPFWGQAEPGGKKEALPEGIRHLRTLEMPWEKSWQLQFVNQNKELLALNAKGLHLWEVSTGVLRHSWPGKYLAFATSADGQTLAVLDAIGEVTLSNLATRKRLWEFRFASGKGNGAALAISADGRWLAVGCSVDVEVWDLQQKKLQYRQQGVTGEYLGYLQFFPDKQQLLVMGFPTYMGPVWNVKSGKTEQVLPLLKNVRSADLSPDGRWLAAGVNFGESSLYFFPACKGVGLRKMSIASEATSLAFSKDSRLLAAACDQETILLLHTKSFQVAATLTVPGVRHLCAAVSSDGQRLAVGSSDRRIRVWDLAGLWKKLPEYEQLTAKRLEQLWHELSYPLSDDDSAYYQLISVPEQAIAFLGQKLKPAQSPNPQRVAEFLKNLESPRFAERAQATQELEALHWLAKPALNEALTRNPKLETRQRMLGLLKKMENTRTADIMRQWRAAWIVASIRTPAALQLLEQWGKGAPAAYLTQEAQRQLASIR